MDLATLIGIIIAGGLVLISILMGGSGTWFINYPSVMIVLGGTMGATLINYPKDDVISMFKVTKHAFRHKTPNLLGLITIMVEFAKKARREGILSFDQYIQLLMVFFVLLFSMGSLDAHRFAVFQKVLQNGMGVLEGGMNAPQGMVSDYQRSLFDLDLPDGDQLMKFSRNEGLETEYTRQGIRITLRDELLFRSGSAQITAEGRRLLHTLGAVIRPMRRYVRIEGHTDDRPISTLRYPSNWELSTARAVNVLTYLLRQGDIEPMLLSAAGYGSCKPRVSNDSRKNRAMNRRVEIMLGKKVSEPNAQSDWR